MFGHHPKFYHEYDLLNHMYDIADEDGCILTVLDEDTLKSIPHVETPIVHAHWRWMPNHDVICSKCQYVLPSGSPVSDFRFCPWCGAKMDKEVE